MKLSKYMNQEYGDIKASRNKYNSSLKSSEKASSCKECGKCEKLCPQHIQIRKMLKEVVETFEK